MESLYDKDEFDNNIYMGDRNIGFNKEDLARQSYIDSVKNHTIQSIFLVRDSEFPD